MKRELNKKELNKIIGGTNRSISPSSAVAVIGAGVATGVMLVTGIRNDKKE